MSYITPRCGFSSRTSHPFDPAHRHRADFARQAVIAEFGWRFAKALDQTDFVDVPPNWRRVGRVAAAIVNQVAAHQPTYLKPQGTEQ